MKHLIFMLIISLSTFAWPASDTARCEVELVGHYGKNAQGLVITSRNEDYNELNIKKDALTESECQSFCDQYEQKEFQDVLTEIGRAPFKRKATKRFYIEYVEECDWGFSAWFDWL